MKIEMIKCDCCEKLWDPMTEAVQYVKSTININPGTLTSQSAANLTYDYCENCWENIRRVINQTLKDIKNKE